MFDAGHQVVILHSAHIGQSFSSHGILVFAEGPEVDDWVVRVIVYIDHRRKIDLNTNPFALPGHVGSHLVNQFVLPHHAAQRHLVGKPDGAIQPHSEAPLPVDSHQQRYRRESL